MHLTELLRPEDVLVRFRAADKWACIEAMMEHLEQAERIPADIAGALREAVLNRERSMSTGMEHGIAIPHAAVDGLAAPVACLAVAPAGLPFDSIDASPARFVVLLLIPRGQKLLHIRTLAEIARVLGDEGVRQALLASESGAEAWRTLAEVESPRAREAEGRPRRTP